MTSLTRFETILRRMQKSLVIALPIQVEQEEIRIGKISFTAAKPSELYSGRFRGQGILVEKLDADATRYCRQNGVSYLTLDGRLRIIQSGQELCIEPVKRHGATHRSKVIQENILSPTVLVSPNGLDALDVLFRVPNSELKGFRSALQFAIQFNLYQPKISLMMRSLNVRTIFYSRTAPPLANTR